MTIRHHAFFEALGNAEAQTPEWNAVFAGLSVLRIVDRIAAKDDVSPPAEWPELHTSRIAVDAVSPGDPVRAILLRIVERIQADSELGSAVGTDLISYGRALDLEAGWSLATDVFESITDIFSPRTYPQLIIEASTLLGAASRNLGDWTRSQRAYTRAEHLAESIGDRTSVLKVQIGLANSEMFRGNLNASDELLDSVLADVDVTTLEAIHALALHAKASVAHLRGDYQRAIHLAHRSLEMTCAPAAREALISDIAASYAGLGMRETARNGYSIVAMTSPHQWVRWQATLNLLELSIDDGDVTVFDDYVRQLESASLDPRLRAYFLFFRARGWQRFGRDGAEKLFDEARDFAERHSLNQISFEIEAEKESKPVHVTGIPTGELADVAEMLANLGRGVRS